jgi:hypothetical protein
LDRDKLFSSAPKIGLLPTEEDQMQHVHAQFVALLHNYESDRSKVLEPLSKVLTMLTTFFAAAEEGFSKAELYEALARKSDSELAALGPSRDHLPRFVMFGKK